jgi:hypothetical protein
MITNNAPLSNAFTDEEPKHNFRCHKRIQPCFLKQYIKKYRKSAFSVFYCWENQYCFPQQKTVTKKTDKKKM